MDITTETREFLTSRRARITPQQAGLSWYSDNRRVPGLRREEVATLAGLSVDYYTRLERGNLSGVSEPVLSALARALQLDDAERAHLFDLAHSSQQTAPPRRRTTKQPVRPSLQRILDTFASPALLGNGRLDILAANTLGRALYSEMYVDPTRPVNSARFVFLDPRATTFYLDWEDTATDIVAALRSEAGQNPYDRAFSDLVGELSTRSEQFRTRWARHNVRFHRTGVKHIHHPLVGDLHLDFERMDLPVDPGLAVFINSAEPGSKSEQALNLLASWAATEATEPSPEAGSRERRPN